MSDSRAGSFIAKVGESSSQSGAPSRSNAKTYAKSELGHALDVPDLKSFKICRPSSSSSARLMSPISDWLMTWACCLQRHGFGRGYPAEQALGYMMTVFENHLSKHGPELGQKTFHVGCFAVMAGLSVSCLHLTQSKTNPCLLASTLNLCRSARVQPGSYPFTRSQARYHYDDLQLVPCKP